MRRYSRLVRTKANTKAIIISFLSLLLLALVAMPAAAQTPAPVRIEVERDQLTTDETLLLTIAVDANAGQAGQPALPVMADFAVLDSSSGRQISIVNGQTSMSTTYQYRLQPLRAGDLIIPQITVEVDGRIYASQPITVRVSQGTGQPQPGVPGFSDPFGGSMDPIDLLNQMRNWDPFAGSGALADPRASLAPIDAPAELAGQDFFVEAAVDNPAPYQGQQVLYTLRFFRAIDSLGQIQYQAPDFTGFWTAGEPQQSEFASQAAGRTYRVTELQTVLFPTVVGDLTIDPAALVIPGGFFSRGGTVSSQRLTLEVKPLPAGAPAGFQGAVGRFTMEGRTDKTAASVGDTVTQEVVIGGRGNIDALPELQWTDAAGWRAFDSRAAADIESSLVDGRWTGSRIFRRMLVPTQAGPLTLPAVEFSFFDPETGSYETLRTEAATLNIAAGASSTASALPAAGEGGGTASRVSTAPALRPLKPAPETWQTAGAPLPYRPGYWLLWGLPLAVLAGHRGWQRWQARQPDRAGSRRQRQAARQAHKALRRAAGDPQTADAASGRILTAYLSDKLGRPLSGLTQAALADLLSGEGLDGDLVQRVLSCLQAGEASDYAPAGTREPGGNLSGQTGHLIDDLEANWPRN